MRTVLLQLHTGSPRKCEAWANVPVANGVQITIYVHQGASPQFVRCAEQCYSMIRRSLIESGGIQEQAPCSGNPVPAYRCQGVGPTRHRRVLIYIADGIGSIEARFETYFLDPGALVIPVVDNSFGNKPEDVLPINFRQFVAERIEHFNILPLIPRILRKAGILSTRFRLFISYRHSDSSEIAGQLFHALSEKKFDVFLDRFSSDTGDDFVALIREELFDKACILVLETNGIGKSVYCRQEVATSTAFNLGLMAIDLPGSRQIFHGIFRRLDLSNAVLQNDKLSTADLNEVLNFIEQYYDHEITRRFRAQDKLLLDSIVAAGLVPNAIGVGQYRVNNGNKEYLLTMSRCPPDVDDYIHIEETAGAPPPRAKAVLFGPISVLRTQRFGRVSWLGSKSDILTIDEGHIQRSLTDISKNRI